MLHKFSIFTISLLILITSSVFSPAYGILLQTFDDPTVTTSDLFGISVSISGNCALVGAPGDDTTGADVGQAHLFDTIPDCGGAPPIRVIGGDIIPLDTTMVLVAGAQYTAAWMIPVIVSAIGIGIVVARKF